MTYTIMSHDYSRGDSYIVMRQGITRGPDTDLQQARVKRRIVDDESKLVGALYNNPY